MELNNIHKKISQQHVKALENKVIELLKPHIDIEITRYNIESVVNELKRNGYSINHLIPTNGLYEEYNITNEITGEKDYFIIKKDFEIVQKENIYTYKTCFSEIIRGIGDKL